jgi:peptide deformylase
MKRDITRMGNPVLRQVADDVSKEYLKTDEFSRLLADMKDSMDHYGGIGIAAPQIGVSLKVALIELMGFNRYGQEVNLPLTAFINPKIEYVDESSQGFWEGCLSVPGLRGYVERPRKVRVTYLDPKGEENELIAEGFLATVLQHELDHLFGVLYVDRIKDTRLLTYQEEYDQFIQPAKEEELE